MARAVSKLCQGVLRWVKVFLSEGKNGMVWLVALKWESRVQKKLANVKGNGIWILKNGRPGLGNEARYKFFDKVDSIFEPKQGMGRKGKKNRAPQFVPRTIVSLKFQEFYVL